LCELPGYGCISPSTANKEQHIPLEIVDLPAAGIAELSTEGIIQLMQGLFSYTRLKKKDYRRFFPVSPIMSATAPIPMSGKGENFWAGAVPASVD
jgi:hypothetical protein